MQGLNLMAEKVMKKIKEAKWGKPHKKAN